MAELHSFIDLTGYRRQRDLERRVWYAPTAILLALVGLVGAVYGLWELRQGVVEFLPHFLAGYAVVLATYGALFGYYVYRFRRLKCPDCDQIMQPYVTDPEEGSYLKFLERVRIAGRSYRPPYNENDNRSWVRLMRHVRACPHCKTFVNCSRLHLETCTAEELSEISRRIST